MKPSNTLFWVCAAVVTFALSSPAAAVTSGDCESRFSQSSAAQYCDLAGVETPQQSNYRSGPVWECPLQLQCTATSGQTVELHALYRYDYLNNLVWCDADLNVAYDNC